MYSAAYSTELEDARKRAERVGELRRLRFEACTGEAGTELSLERIKVSSEFEVWLAKLPEERKKQIAGGMSLGSHVARSILRAEYVCQGDWI